LDGDEWEGPILGPTCLSLLTILNTNYGFDENNAELDAAFAEQVALHVLPRHELFVHWRDVILNRLMKLAPVDAAPPPGTRLPRQVLDPSMKIAPQSLDALRKQALEQLDLIDNPFSEPLNRDEP
jgi:hypothetical protein